MNASDTGNYRIELHAKAKMVMTTVKRAEDFLAAFDLGGQLSSARMDVYQGMELVLKYIFENKLCVIFEMKLK